MRSGLHVVLLVLALTPAVVRAEPLVVSSAGQLRSVLLDGEYLTLQTDLCVPAKGWGSIARLGEAKDCSVEVRGDATIYRGRLEVAPGQSYTYEQELTPVEGGLDLALTVRSGSDEPIEGVMFWLDLPIADWAGAEAALSNRGVEGTATCPTERQASRHFLGGLGDCLRFRRADGSRELTCALGALVPWTVQDNREWNTDTYTAFATLHLGALANGQTVEATVRLRWSGTSDHSPVALTLDTSRPLYRMDGFGGDYCFEIESPVTDYTLTNLRVAWARTEMTLDLWEPRNDNASATDATWEYLRAQDRPGSELHNEFALGQRIRAMGIPSVVSCWHPPAWVTTDPGADRFASGRRLVEGMLPELVECVATYLEYAKEQYGYEPTLVSFNEADYGVMLYQGPEDHRQWIRAMGAELARRGLATKLLLGDVAAPRGSIGFIEPAAADPEAMRYVGALAFHSWGGATPEQYEAWGGRARALGLPLLVTELGVDSSAWQGGAYDSYAYGMREARMYQELVLYAQPRGTMQWEFTADYGIARVDGAAGVVPTQRYWLVKHFTDLTPARPTVLATGTSDDRVLVTAFRGEGGALAVHVVNSGAAREATLTGIPAGVTSLAVTRTSEAESFVTLDPVPVEAGVARLTLPAQSVTTLGGR